MTLRIQTSLHPDQETLISRVLGCCVRVHTALGPGLLEAVYAKAVGIELSRQQIPFEREKAVPIHYHGQLLCEHRLDLVVASFVVVELKSVERFASVHQAQLLSYLRASGLRVGLLLNFNAPVVAVKRLVL